MRLLSNKPKQLLDIDNADLTSDFKINTLRHQGHLTNFTRRLIFRILYKILQSSTENMF